MRTRKQLNGRVVGRRMPPTSLAEGPGAPAAGVILQSRRVDALLRTALGTKLTTDPGIRYGDGYYYAPTRAEVELILAASALDRKTWMEERFDCDDFAYCLKGEMCAHAYDGGELRFGFCVGILWGDFSWVQGFHAINWFVGADEQLWLIEPQSDTLYGPKECVGGIRLVLV